MSTPDSASTKHSLTMVQRQYIDSRFSENVGDYMKSILEALQDITIELMTIRSKLTMVNHRLQKLEDRQQKDDNTPPTQVSLDSQQPKKDKV
jgi:hypothetical protein